MQERGRELAAALRAVAYVDRMAYVQTMRPDLYLRVCEEIEKAGGVYVPHRHGYVFPGRARAALGLGPDQHTI